MTKELDNVLDELNFVPDSDNYFVNQAIQFRELMMMYNCAIRECAPNLRFSTMNSASATAVILLNSSSHVSKGRSA